MTNETCYIVEWYEGNVLREWRSDNFDRADLKAKTKKGFLFIVSNLGSKTILINYSA